VCIGKGHCNLGLIDTESLSQKILDKFAVREKTKAKFKIAIAGCTLCRSGVKNSDIGIMATREGFEIFAGGKGGPFPKIGMRIERMADEQRLMDVITELVSFHELKTETKQRMHKLLDHPDFPFKAI